MKSNFRLSDKSKKGSTFENNLALLHNDNKQPSNGHYFFISLSMVSAKKVEHWSFDKKGGFGAVNSKVTRRALKVIEESTFQIAF